MLTHYSITKAANILGLNMVDVALNKQYTMSLACLKKQLVETLKKDKCVTIVATAGYNVVGTTDDIEKINNLVESLDNKFRERVFLHIDAATLGFISPFLADKHKFFKYKNVRSITIDGHKTGLIPYPCGIFLIRKRLVVNSIKRYVEYLGNTDQTLIGSRPGASAAALWAMLEGIGLRGYKNIAQECINNKKHLVNRLKKVFSKITILDNPVGNIVGIHFDQLLNGRLNDSVEKRYSLHPSLVSVDQKTRKIFYQVVVMPDINTEIIDSFVKEVSEKTN